MFKITNILSLCSLLFLLNGCSKNADLTMVSSSEIHHYRNDFGLVEEAEVQEQLEQEENLMQDETQYTSYSSFSEEPFVPEEGTFLAEDWVEPETTYSYKYLDDPKFYSEEELPENKMRKGKTIIKIPSSMSKEEAFSNLESSDIDY